MTPPAIGNPGFTLGLGGYDPFVSTALFNLASGTGVPFVCGSCNSILPAQTIAVPTPFGATSISLPIPNKPALVGVQLTANWFTLGGFSTPCPLFPNVSSSNVVRITIGA